MNRLLISAAAGALIGLGLTAAAQAYAPGEQARSTPKSWNYELKGGKRVPKANRVAKADGSWREEVRNGKCLTVREKTAAGEYRESRRCD